jgi:NhaP-type Na+/H+ or K+/H+ antiporter
MLTVALLLFGAVLLSAVLADRALRTLPLTPAVVYLVVGWLAGAVLGAPDAATLVSQAPTWVVATEVAVLMSLLAVGLRLRVPGQLRLWAVALLLAGPGVVVAVAVGAALAVWLLQLPWPAALVLAAVMAPTDPVLASEVQIRHGQDRDAVRLSLTAEGGLNDGSVLPAVMLGLGLMGLHSLGDGGVLGSPRWWWYDLVWPIGGGAALGMGLGWVMGRALKWRTQTGDKLARDELLYVGAVALGYGLARWTHTSSFVVVFALGVTLLEPFRSLALADGGQALADRLHAFGARIERLVEAATVLAVGLALHAVQPSWEVTAFGLLLVLVVRPLSVFAVVRRQALTRSQRRLVAWFGIRGIGTLFYLAFAIEHGVGGSLAEEMIGATLVAIALSIVLHGVSATPLMTRYQARRPPNAPPPPPVV